MFLRLFIVGIVANVLSGCLGLPKGVHPVNDFELERYLGKWYEIARLDHSFERGLDRVTAEYSLRKDGGIQVVNKGFSVENKDWKEIKGKAYFVRDSDEGYLKVSFFGPFYGSYVVFDLDIDYQYAFVSGVNTSYLWLLARTPTVSEALLERFIRTANDLGFETDRLIFLNQID
ncbi:MAG: lipocalin family protein [Arenicellales bacterium]|nr:lipocalin family protein [Arenicellales bacterium]